MGSNVSDWRNNILPYDLQVVLVITYTNLNSAGCQQDKYDFDQSTVILAEKNSPVNFNVHDFCF